MVSPNRTGAGERASTLEDGAFPPLPASVPERTVPQLLRAAVEECPDRPALIGHSLVSGGEVTLSYGELAERARRCASVLEERGVGRGDRVAIMIGNDGAIEAHVAYHGAHQLGAVCAPINTFSVGRELGYALALVRPAAIVFAPQFGGLVASYAGGGASPALLEVARDPRTGEAAGRLLEAADERAARADAAEADDADWIFTSGTTGQPKAVALTHGSSVACGYEAQCIWGLGGASVYQSSAPFFTSTGCHTNLLASLAARSTYVVDPEPAVELALHRAARHGTSSLFLPTALVAILFRRMDAGRATWPEGLRLTRFAYGGQTMPREFHERVQREFADERGVELVMLYGLTEGGTAGLMLDPEDHVEAVRRHGRYGVSVGRRGWNEWIEHRIVGEDGDDVEPGQIGEIRLRAPSVMSRYVDDEKATAAALAGGWLHTGDMATADDDGFVFFVDRSKSMIRRGAMNIAAAEVEGVALGHPAVAEVAALGRPNPVLGEDVHLFVVLHPGAETSEEEIIEFCRRHLAEYKVPRSIAFRHSLPRNAMNRVVRGDLVADLPR